MTNKEAIEQLKWVKKRICDITYSPESFEALNLAIKALEEERPQGWWIPVSKRLPDNNDEYLVIDADGNFGVGYYREDAKAWDSCNWGWLERSNSTDDTCPAGMGKVIAWQPLPGPYTENSYDTSDT